jgi:hypothetical protein
MLSSKSLKLRANSLHSQATSMPSSIELPIAAPVASITTRIKRLLANLPRLEIPIKLEPVADPSRLKDLLANLSLLEIPPKPEEEPSPTKAMACWTI